MVKHVIASFLLSLILAPGLLNAQGGSAPPGQKPQPQSPPASTPAQPRSEPVFVIAPPAGGPGQSSAPTPVNPNSYRIGLQDEVKITVFNEADLTNMYRVDADGSI